MRHVWLDDAEPMPREERRVPDPLGVVIERLASAIDATGESDAHVRRMTVYATGLARALSLPSTAVEEIRIAALLHDIGYLGIAQHILLKPGPLSEDEFTTVAAHPQIGVDILRGVPIAPGVLTAVLGHHERWDGTGYPLKLREEAIPVAARILAVVDCFDALTRDRPYRQRIGVDAALTVLREESGRAFDPRIVEAFVETCPGLLADVTAQGLSEPGAPDGLRHDTLRRIGQANEELYALHRLGTAVGSTMSVRSLMAVVASELPALIPFDTAALYLADAETADAPCIWAAGPDADSFRSRMPSAATTPGPLLAQSLQMSGRPIGTLVLHRSHTVPGPGAAFTDDHRRLLESVSDPVGAAVYRALAYERALAASLTDGTTGLPTPRFLALHLARELARARRLRTDVGVILVGPDQAGPPAAPDGALAGVVSGMLRGYDLCVAESDGTLVVVLSGAGYRECRQRADAIQGALEARQASAQASETPRSRICTGLAIFPHDADTADDLLALARQRLTDERTPPAQPLLPLQPH